MAAWCSHCNRYYQNLVEHIHSNMENIIMTQPNPDQATLDDLADALTTAYPALQAAVQQSQQPPAPEVAPLSWDAAVAAAQLIVDLTAPPAPAEPAQ